MTQSKTVPSVDGKYSTKIYICDANKCSEISSLKTAGGGHLCLEHFFKTIDGGQ